MNERLKNLQPALTVWEREAIEAETNYLIAVIAADDAKQLLLEATARMAARVAAVFWEQGDQGDQGDE